jgi:KamA family protein
MDSKEFIVKFVQTDIHQPYKNIPEHEWNDWRWQLKNRVYDYEILCNLLGISEENGELINQVINRYPLALTPYTIREMYKFLSEGKINEFNVLWKIYVPSKKELLSFSENPVVGTGEDLTTPFENCYQFFPDRVLIRITSMCPSLCRYCFVRQKVSSKGRMLNKEEIYKISEFLRKRENIRDVIISGGDPLLISDDYLTFILRTLREIPHVDILRIDSKVPNSLPQRITPELAKILSSFNPVYLNTHITHPCEITQEVKYACNLLADHGIILGAHIPLLRGINDSPEVVEQLVIQLLKLRVRPYMLIHYIQTDGADHFATSIEKGIEIIEHLWGRVSGLAVPQYVLYLPQGGGKIPLSPNYVLKREGNSLIVKNYEGRIFKYNLTKL